MTRRYTLTKPGRMKMREQEDRNMEKTVWSLPGLRSDIIDRRLAAKASNDRYLEAIRKAMGQ